MAYGNPVIKPQPRPAVPRPSERQRNWPANKRVAPKVVTTDPQTTNPRISVPKIAGIVGKTLAPFIASIMSPTRVADATIDWGPELYNNFIDAPPDLKRMVVSEPLAPNIPIPPEMKPYPFNQMSMIRPPIPEIPWAQFPDYNLPGFTKSPIKGTMDINVPDYTVIEPIPFEADPTHDVWDIPHEIPWDVIFPDVVPPRGPHRETEKFRNPRLSRVNERGITIELSKLPNGRPRIRIRPQRQRASKPRRSDQKANRKWLKVTHMLISITYGTYTEIMDFLEALAWNSYQMRNGKKIPAMPLEDGNLINILTGVLEGKYDVDMQQLIVDYAYMQLQDFLIGKMSQGIVSQAIDTGGWQSPIGPEAFVNKMFDNEALKDYQVDNSWIKSQFEKGMNYVSTPRQ